MPGKVVPSFRKVRIYTAKPEPKANSKKQAGNLAPSAFTFMGMRLPAKGGDDRQGDL